MKTKVHGLTSSPYRPSRATEGAGYQAPVGAETATEGAETATEGAETFNIPTVWILATGAIYANEFNEIVWFSLVTAQALTDNFTVNVTVTESHNMLQSTSTSPVEFFAGAGNAVLSVAIDNDNTSETDSTVTATIMPGTGYRIVSPSSASQTVVDDDT